MNVIDMNFQINKFIIMACTYVGLKLAFQITFAQSDFLWNVNVQMTTVCSAMFSFGFDKVLNDSA